jgi:hypothetical protein
MYPNWDLGLEINNLVILVSFLNYIVKLFVVVNNILCIKSVETKASVFSAENPHDLQNNYHHGVK